jgi:hypothetical protein
MILKASRSAKRHSWAAALALGILVVSGAARAQAPVIYGDGTPGMGSAGGVITEPSEVAACLCHQRELDAATQALSTAKANYETAQQRNQALEQQVNTVRPQVDPANTDQLDAYRRLVRQSEMANADFYNKATPDYSAAVTRYNTAVNNYNASCAGRGIDPALKAQVEANLYCPAAQ